MKHSDTTWIKELFYSPAYTPNTTETWCPMDTEERYEQTIRSYRRQGKEFPWSPESFSYTFNEFGFRGPSPKSLGGFKILASGCSYTMGIGLPYDSTWPHLLSKQIPSSVCINLAVGGRSGDYVVRSIYKTIDIIKPDLVAILWPPMDRFDVVIDKRTVSKSAIDRDYPKVFADEETLQFYLQRNIAFLEEICSRSKTKLIYNTAESMFKELFDRPTLTVPARDDAHPGEDWQRGVSEIMYRQYVEKYKYYNANNRD